MIINTINELKSLYKDVTKSIAIVAAISENYVIGKDGTIPWKNSEDLQYFKMITTDHAIIMGRKTFESIGKPLPNRRNIVVSAKSYTAIPGAEVYPSLIEAIVAAKQTDSEPRIIGGEQIYRQALPIASKLYITWIKEYIKDGDAKFPGISDLDFPQKEILTENNKAIYCIYSKKGKIVR
jgi:dihydrofolate reductase